jgi:hypothetical protein
MRDGGTTVGDATSVIYKPNQLAVLTVDSTGRVFRRRKADELWNMAWPR